MRREVPSQFLAGLPRTIMLLFILTLPFYNPFNGYAFSMPGALGQILSM